MKNKSGLEQRWNKINSKSKKWHQFVGAPLFKNVPLMLGLVLVLELIDGSRKVDFRIWIASAIVKVLIAYCIGIIWGGMEWDYLENLIQRKFTSIKEAKQKYILIYGIVFYGSNMTVALLNPMFENTVLTIIKLVIYQLAGLAFGVIMAEISISNLKTYIAKE